MKDFILEPTDRFELLRVWEASKFASPALSRQPIEMTLNQKRKSFGVESAQSLPPEMQQPPQLCFDGEPVAHRQDLAVLLNCSRLVAQYKTHQGNFVVLISANARRAEQRLLEPSHFTWSTGRIFSNSRVEFFNLLFAVHIDAKKIETSIVRFGHSLYAEPTSSASSTDTQSYMYNSVESFKFSDDGLIVRFHRGPAAALDLVAESKWTPEARHLGYRLPTTPFTFVAGNLWESPQHYIQAEWLVDENPLHVTILPRRSWWRGIKQLLQPKLKTSDLIQLDPAQGWKDYQGGDVAAEMQAQLSL